MLNPLNFISKFIKSSNQRELDKIAKIVKKINSLEEATKMLDDSDFPKKTLEFKEKIKNGENLNQILPEAFALVKETCRRFLNHSEIQVKATEFDRILRILSDFYGFLQNFTDSYGCLGIFINSLGTF